MVAELSHKMHRGYRGHRRGQSLRCDRLSNSVLSIPYASRSTLRSSTSPFVLSCAFFGQCSLKLISFCPSTIQRGRGKNDTDG